MSTNMYTSLHTSCRVKKFSLFRKLFFYLYIFDTLNSDDLLVNIKAAEPIEPTFYVRPRVTPGKVYRSDDRIFKNLLLTNI